MSKELSPLEAFENIVVDLTPHLKEANKEEIKIVENTLKDSEYYLKLADELGEQNIKLIHEQMDNHKQLKALKIIKEKEIDVWLLKVCDYDNYCRIRTKALETNVESMVDCDKSAIPLPTKEEFDLAKEVLL